MDKPDSPPSPDDATQSSLSKLAKLAQWLVLIFEFLVASAIMLSVTDFGHRTGAVLITGLIIAFSLYEWQPSIFGRYGTKWWAVSILPSAVASLILTAILGLQVSHVQGSWHIGLDEGWLFWAAMFGPYIQAWGWVRTMVVEAVQKWERNKERRDYL